jgi:hypothetical protein
MNVAQETLGFRRQGLSPCLSLLMSAFALPISPASLSTHLHRRTERSSTTPSDSSNPLRITRAQRATTHREEQLAMNETNLSESLEIRSFGYRLEPRYIFRAGRLDQ